MRSLRPVLLLVLLALGPLLLGQLSAPRHDIEVLRDIAFATPGRQTLRLDLYRPQGVTTPVPVILALHGGSWMAGSRDEVRPIAEMMAARGYAVVVPEYRLAPQHTYPAQLEDVRAAARWIAAHAAEYRFDMARYVACGVSAGAQLVALHAVQPQDGVPQPVAVVDFFGPMDFTAPVPSLKAKLAVRMYLGADREENPARYAQASPITHVTPESPPFCIFHGADDALVPFSQSTRMVEALRAKAVPVTFLAMRGTGHALPDFTTPVGQQTAATLFEFLRERGL